MIKILDFERISTKDFFELSHEIQEALLINKRICLLNGVPCINIKNTACKCIIFSGDNKYPNMFNKDLNIEKIKLNSKIVIKKPEEGIYEAKL